MAEAAWVPLARKWRPRSFAEVVGQDEIVRALTNAVAQDRLAHAYLFSGPRGVGKTTTARLLAASINCHSSPKPTPTPCGTCVSCTEVFEGRSIDALEIDGATHGKVDQARDLIEVVSYAPARDRRRVFIIDEVHAISQAAFQALLKTLEEPPAHAVFILATTERHKIPATILSRCQRFDFRRLTDDEVARRLAEIAEREGFGVTEKAEKGPAVETAALGSLAAASTGSLRDALSLFDQAAARSGGRVTAADVGALLGAPDRSQLVSLLSAILGGDRAAVLRGCVSLERSGSDPRASLHDFAVLAQGLVRLAADPSAPPPAGLSEEAAGTLASLARVTPYPTLLRILALLAEADGSLRRSETPALALEVLMLRLAELPRLVPIEELLSGKAGFSAPSLAVKSEAPGRADAGGQGAFSSKGEGASVRSTATAPASTGSPVLSPSRRKPPAGAAVPSLLGDRGGADEREAEDSPDSPRFVGLTPLAIEPDPVPEADAGAAFRSAVEKRQAQLAAVLEDASITFDGRAVRIVFDPPNLAAEKRLGEPALAKALEEAAVTVFGKGARAVVEGALPPGGDLTAAAAEADADTLERESLKRRVSSDERVKRMLELFDAEIADVKRDEGES